MAYTIPQILGWMAISQPLARVGEAKRLALGDHAADIDLDIKLYMTRLDIQYAYNQNEDADIQFIMGNYGLMLCGRYLFPAQQATGGTAVTPISPVNPIQSIISPIYITGANFASATAWNGSNSLNISILSSYTLQVYWNDIPRFLIEGTEWTRTSTGITIDISGFDATTTNLNSVFYIYISR